MKPAPFRYLLPHSLAEALAMKAEHGEETRFLAGGQSLVPAMNFRLAQPAVLIDLNALAGLDSIGEHEIGALARNAAIEHDATIARAQPLVHEAMPEVAHAQIRNRGTLGGNLANADPASEMPAVMLALGARMRLRSLRGERVVAAEEFFVGVYSTALAADEMLVAIELPGRPARTGTAFLEIARRKGDFALAGVAAVVTLDAAGVCTGASWAYCNAGPRPIHCGAAARAIVGTRVTDADIAAAVALSQTAIEPTGNVHASAAFQRHLAAVLTRRALRRACERAAR